MAIAFNCPYCTAAIKVPDQAAGKSGKCPKCGESLLVPKVAPPPPQSSPPPPEPAEEVPEFTPVVHAEVSLGRVARSRARRKGVNILWPILLGLIMIGTVGFLVWKPEPEMGGTLTGTSLGQFELPPSYIDKARLIGEPDAIDALLETLEAQPLPQVTVENQYSFVVDAHERGLELKIEPEPEAAVYRVDPNQDKLLREFLTAHRGELLSAWEDELSTRIPRFVEHLTEAQAAGTPFNLQSWREPLGFNAMVKGVGYHVQAVVGGKEFRCCREDDDGRLYFILPADLKQFELIGRKLGSEQPLIPGRFTVNVIGRDQTAKTK